MSTRSGPWWRRKTTIAAIVGAGLFSLGCSVGGELVAYEDLPPESDRYTLEVDNGDATTVWEYNSSQPTESTSIQPCLGAGLGDPTLGECRPEPLIFLRYDFGLELDDTVKPNRPHTFTVNGYYQEQLGTPPEVSDLSVEFSYDGGQTWRLAQVRELEADTFKVTAKHPRDAGSVDVRVSAGDSDGNTVVQTLPGAFSVC